MKKTRLNTRGFHYSLNGPIQFSKETKMIYRFFNYFHPFVGEFIEQLNKNSLAGLFDVDFQSQLVIDFFQTMYEPQTNVPNSEVDYSRTVKELDLSEDGSYSIYNWELFFHIPLIIAVNLSKNQRFAEAQKWFHYIFDPTSTDKSIEPPLRFWKFLQFRKKTDVQLINELLENLSDPEDNEQKEQVLNSIEAWRNKPFQPYVIARNRFLAYQFNVVMKYLDNLIAWGDSLFRQDTIETLNEATQVYILAANILGPRPQKIPPLGKQRPKTFAMLKQKLDAFGNALVDLEGQFPFNLNIPSNRDTAGNYDSNVLFGIAKTLYFCIPQNDKLLEYWDLIGDRLFKIRHCMNIEGVVRQLPLFEPPLDPGMLVKAAAAGIDISSLVSGLNQPISLIRFPLLIQKALEICGEVRNLGNMLLSTVEKKDGEELAILRQGHEIKILQMVQDVKYLQWKEAESATESLLNTRESSFQRYRHYQLLLGKNDNDLKDIQNITIERTELNEENFDEIYNQLVEKYAKQITLESYRTEQNIEENKDSLQLNKSENEELNVYMPSAHELQQAAAIVDAIVSYLSIIPQFDASARPMGTGAGVDFGGVQLSKFASVTAQLLRLNADDLNYQANRASKFAAYQRRIEDWILQNNLAASELVQIGRQIISSLIREQLAKKDYENHKKQIENAQEIDIFIREMKFTNKDLYTWMQGEISKIYYECYKFAFDIAKKTEQTMKHEVMREELDNMTFIKFNYWDSGRKGLLAGEALYLDLKRMEMAYHDYNRREYEIVKHVSIQQLDPKALLQLKTTGSCEITIPEYLFDVDCPGHYMRRIKTVSMSIPCVVGPYASINCTMSLVKSTVRRSPLLLDGEYSRSLSGGEDDDRFEDYFGTIQSIVTSNAQNDSGLFERNLRDERYLPFEGAGAESTWKLEIPITYKQFDNNTISDVILHMMYTARNGGETLKSESVKHLETIIENENTSGLTNFFSLKHNFPSEWYKFTSSTADDSLKIIIRKDHFPYLAQSFDVKVKSIDLFAIKDKELIRRNINIVDDLNDGINGDQHQIEMELTPDTNVLNRENDHVFLIVSYFLEK
jgi:hypothetical protein